MPSNHLRVATLNIWNRSGPWPERLRLIREQLRVLDPEDLPAAMRAEAQRYAITVFNALGCEGISRIDFLINADTNELFFNEINTLPGSLAFYLWSAAPHYWTITDLLTRLIDRAERLRAMKRGLQRKPPPELRLLS